MAKETKPRAWGQPGRGLKRDTTNRSDCLNSTTPPKPGQCYFDKPCPVGRCQTAARELPGEIITGGTLRRFYTSGNNKAYNFSIIGGIEDQTVIICQSVVSAEIIRLATGCSVVVVYCEDNFMPVMWFFRNHYPELNTIVAADNSFKDEVNAGLREANRAAKYNGCPMVIVPPIINHHYKFDFHDLAEELGLDAVRQCIEAARVGVLTCRIL